MDLPRLQPDELLLEFFAQAVAGEERRDPRGDPRARIAQGGREGACVLRGRRIGEDLLEELLSLAAVGGEEGLDPLTRDRHACPRLLGERLSFDIGMADDVVAVVDDLERVSPRSGEVERRQVEDALMVLATIFVDEIERRTLVEDFFIGEALEAERDRVLTCASNFFPKRSFS